MDKKLAQMKCSACRGHESPLTAEAIEEMLPQVPDNDFIMAAKTDARYSPE